MTSPILANSSGIDAVLHAIRMSYRWDALTAAQRRVLLNPETWTNQPLTRLRALGYVDGHSLELTRLGARLREYAVTFKGAKA